MLLITVKLLEQNPEEVEVVKKIFELVLDGKTLYGVMQYLNDRNIMIGKGMPSLSILSRIIHNELYIGIRRRTQSFGKDKGKEDAAIQHIEPIISEEDFRRAGEKIAINNKYVSTAKVYFNPFKTPQHFCCKSATTWEVASRVEPLGRVTSRLIVFSDSSGINTNPIHLIEIKAPIRIARIVKIKSFR
jgi:site-specific DNA recombinase